MNPLRSATFGAALSLLATQSAFAQYHDTHISRRSSILGSPYAGLEKRPIKALSDEQIADLQAGRGMGLALAAELNGYPGPTHALELADSLDLSAEQRTRTAALFEQMKAEVIPMGERVIAEEAALDRLFAEKRMTLAALDNATARIAVVQGELRAAHLRYHLEMVDVLTPAQIASYDELRGYGGSDAHQHQQSR